MKNVVKTTLMRILSAIVALPVYFYAIVTDSFQSIPILIASLVITLSCLYEYYQITDKGEEGRAFLWIGIAVTVILNAVMYLFAFGKLYGYNKYIGIFDARLIMALIVAFLAVILILQLFMRPIKGGNYSLSVTVMGVMFLAFSFSHIILMKALMDGVYYIIMLNIVVMINDSLAYFGGVLFGKHKTKFAVSPNKSWEGYFTGLLFSIVAMIVTNQVYISFFDKHLFSVIEAVILGIVLSFLGNIGDLVESATKRDGSIKDSGSIIPGHGGMWDVFDAMIFSLPIFYYYLIFKGVL